jgi:hypothetical protein
MCTAGYFDVFPNRPLHNCGTFTQRLMPVHRHLKVLDPAREAAFLQVSDVVNLVDSTLNRELVARHIKSVLLPPTFRSISTLFATLQLVLEGGVCARHHPSISSDQPSWWRGCKPLARCWGGAGLQRCGVALQRLELRGMF